MHKGGLTTVHKGGLTTVHKGGLTTVHKGGLTTVHKGGLTTVLKGGLKHLHFLFLNLSIKRPKLMTSLLLHTSRDLAYHLVGSYSIGLPPRGVNRGHQFTLLLLKLDIMHHPRSSIVSCSVPSHPIVHSG